jgi:hypothetical protein
MIRQRRQALALLLTLSVVAVAAPAAESVDEYAHRANLRVELQAGRPATWYQVDLPIQVPMGAAHADLRDLRVFNAEGEALPHALTTGTARYIQSRREVKGKIFPLYAVDESSAEITLDGGLKIRRDAAGAVEIDIPPGKKLPPPTTKRVLRGWLVDARGADFPLQELSIQWQTGPEGFYPFTVEASDDLEHWRRWAQGQIVHLSFNDETIDQGEVRLPGRQARYLRLLWKESWVAGAVHEVRLSGTASGVELAPLVWSPPLPGEAVAGREGEYVWHLPVALPLVRVRIPLAEDNSLAPVILSGRDFQPPSAAPESPLSGEKIAHDHTRLRDVLRRPPRQTQTRPFEAPWQTLARRVLYRLPAIALQDDELDLPGTAVNQLRLQVDVTHGGNAFGHAAPELVGAIHAQQLTFLARGSAPYQLAWGKQKAQAAALPLSTLIPGAVGADQLGRAQVMTEGVALPVVAPAPPAGEEEGIGQGKLVLWAVLLLGVILLAAMAISLLKSAPRDKPE